MVIVHLSENQRRVIAAEKGETVDQLCERVCKELSYSPAQFQFCSTITNEPLPLNLIVTEIKEVRLIRNSATRTESQDSCYRLIEDKSPQSNTRKETPLPPPLSNTFVQIEKGAKRSAPPPPLPPVYKLLPDYTIDDADVDIPAPPSDPIPKTGLESQTAFLHSVECGTDQIASPQVCHGESYNSSSVDSSEEASPSIDDITIITDNILSFNQKIEANLDSSHSDKSSVNDFSDPAIVSMVNSRSNNDTKKEERESKHSPQAVPVYEKLDQHVPIPADEERRKSISVDTGYSVDLTASSPATTNSDSPVIATPHHEPVVISTVPVSSNKKFWEPAKPTKQLVFTPKKMADNETKTQDTHAATSSTSSDTVDSANVKLATPIEFVVQERVVLRSGRPEYVPVKPKSLFFTAGNK